VPTLSQPIEIPTTTETVGKWGKIASLFISVFSFLVALGAGLALAISIAIGVILGLFILASLYITFHFGLHSKILERIRRQILYALTSVVIDYWKVNIKIDEMGNAKVAYNIDGKINFGFNRWLPVRVEAGSDQDSLNFKAINNFTSQELKVEQKMSTPKYRIFQINFDHVLKRNDRFSICVEYDVKNTFFFDREDFYSHRANHYEKRIGIAIEFPKTIELLRVWQTVETEHGDVWQDIEPAQLPTPQKALWNIGKAYYGNNHTLYWTSRRIILPKSKS
jgi:hypothetical protein